MIHMKCQALFSLKSEKKKKKKKKKTIIIKEKYFKMLSDFVVIGFKG